MRCKKLFNEQIDNKADMLDDICHKYSEVGYDTVSSLGKSLYAIAQAADQLGFTTSIQLVDSWGRGYIISIDRFLQQASKFVLDEDSYFDITYIDGNEPGDHYIITINDVNGAIEAYADFVFSPKE